MLMFGIGFITTRRDDDFIHRALSDLTGFNSLTHCMKDHIHKSIKEAFEHFNPFFSISVI